MRLNGGVLALPFSDIDTDQIIPASYLSVVEPGGLGEHLFDGQVELLRRLHEADGASIIVAHDNFGSGSSREHAVWALTQRGFRAIVAASYSRIFLENAYNNGLVPIAMSREDVQRCMESRTLEIDVEGETIHLPDGSQTPFSLDPLRKLFLLEGGYVRYLQAKIPAVREWQRCRG